ncbi:sulfotransferase [Pirellulales bacterium]|nr:sulfotransferase [Pirellulales bacterium]
MKPTDLGSIESASPGNSPRLRMATKRMNDDQLLAAPVIVVGSPRSGTTALGEMLEVHSTLNGLVEPRLTWRYGNDGKSDMFQAADATPAVIEHIRRNFAGHVREAGRTRLLEKTPSNALRVEFVRRVFPDAKIIHIIRNGIDSSLSIRSFWENAAHGIKIVRKGAFRQRLKEMRPSQAPHYALEAVRRFAPRSLTGAIGQNMWGPRLPGMRAMLRDLELLEVCALQWRTCVEAAKHAGAKIPAENYYEFKLEELTRSKFDELLQFAELESEPEIIQNFEAKFQPGLARGRRSDAAAEDIETILRWIAPTMEWLGYAI